MVKFQIKIMVNRLILIFKHYLLLFHFLMGIFLAPLPLVYIIHSTFALQEDVVIISDKLLKQSYHKLRKIPFYKLLSTHTLI